MKPKCDTKVENLKSRSKVTWVKVIYDIAGVIPKEGVAWLVPFGMAMTKILRVIEKNHQKSLETLKFWNFWKWLHMIEKYPWGTSLWQSIKNSPDSTIISQLSGLVLQSLLRPILAWHGPYEKSLAFFGMEIPMLLKCGRDLFLIVATHAILCWHNWEQERCLKFASRENRPQGLCRCHTQRRLAGFLCVWHWLQNIIYDGSRVIFYSQCHTQRRIGGAQTAGPPTLLWVCQRQRP